MIKGRFLLSQLAFFLLMPLWLELSHYLHPVVIGVVWLCFSVMALFVIGLLTRTVIMIPSRVLHGLAFFHSLGLFILLFYRPNSQDYDEINLIPFSTISHYLSGKVDFLIAFYNLAANIALFIPFGLYYRYLAKKPSWSSLLVFATGSIGLIETFQFLTKRGSLDIDDILLNVLGVGIGALGYPFVHKVFVVKKD